MRNEALTQKRVGPMLLVTGSTQSGKSTLCKMLVNYSLKLGWSPVFADIDL
jgi:polyribonucleotide 5'-hydroxyl-kinase